MQAAQVRCRGLGGGTHCLHRKEQGIRRSCHLTWALAGDGGIVPDKDRGEAISGVRIVGQRSEAGGEGWEGLCGFWEH